MQEVNQFRVLIPINIYSTQCGSISSVYLYPSTFTVHSVGQSVRCAYAHQRLQFTMWVSQFGVLIPINIYSTQCGSVSSVYLYPSTFTVHSVGQSVRCTYTHQYLQYTVWVSQFGVIIPITRCPQRGGFDPPLGTFSGRGDFSLGANMGSNSIPPKTLSDESMNRGLVCAHMHFIARTQKILTIMS